jgi:FkbM family methyltransferase
MLDHITSRIKSAAHYAFPRTSMRLIGSRRRHDEIELDLLPAIVDADREAVDVGANVGRYAVPLARLARHVHVFEPHPRLARMLAAALPSNATVRQIAISDRDGATVLHIPIAAGCEEEAFAFVDQERQKDVPCRQVDVAMMPLDPLSERDIGFVKIDVEGHEMRVLLGAGEIIRRRRPIFLVEAENRHNLGGVRQVADFFEDQGYIGVFIHNRIVTPIGSFDPAMQDPTLFGRLPASTPRRDVPYVNNFLFVPVQLAKSDIFNRVSWILRHGGFDAQSPDLRTASAA